MIQSQANDPDSGDHAIVWYELLQLEGSQFTVETETGVVRLSTAYFKENSSHSSVSIRAYDNRGSNPSLSAVTQVEV